MDNGIKVAILFLIILLRYRAICLHGNSLTLATVRILTYGQSFADHANSRQKMNRCQLFCKFHCTQAKDNKKKSM